MMCAFSKYTVKRPIVYVKVYYYMSQEQQKKSMVKVQISQKGSDRRGTLMATATTQQDKTTRTLNGKSLFHPTPIQSQPTAN